MMSMYVLIMNLIFFRPIGVPGLHKVTIHNINSHSSIQMLSISGNTIHFHCSFFEDKVRIEATPITFVNISDTCR